MALRSLATGGLLTLALTLAACSGSETATEDTAAPEAAAVTAPDAAAPMASEDAASAVAATEEPVADPAEVAEIAAKATPEPAPAKAAPPVAEVVKVAELSPPASYGRCAVCHTANKGGENKLGPNLYGVYGSAAAQGSFAYSEALKGAGLKWDEATLHTWLENPRAMVPGNRMSFPGIKDAGKRQEIIDFLKQQS